MAAQQHTLFQNYLAQSKDKFLKNLNVKIFPKTSIEDYEFMKTLGHGSYGQVVSARNIHDGKIFAVKIVKKKKMIREDQVKHLISEIRILNAIKFDFMIFLECYFTSSCNIFIVLPQITGGQFFRLLRKLKKLDENSAKFYAAQVVLAIEYLHYMGIVYRDLKPENMLLDTDGYLKLVDFGFSKHIGKSTTYTFCGTPEYIAPEILLSRGYSKSPDWWTLGILLYEMCNGTPPFTAKNELKLYEKILVGNINWPEHFSPALRSLVKGLLEVYIRI
ncbi:hypothetical protein RUM44_013041 [Polyplax serrata]|uniref:cAMP-dependent protein kinase n=1 Tax=Polyplax serrata TaxID=468196 RepID=A0ABR1BDC2_POLSC